MPVKVIKKSATCKLCRHEKADEINQLLERWQHKEKGDDGKVITWDYVVDRLKEWGVDNPTYDNWKASHRKHIEFVSPGKAAVLDAQAEEDEKDWIEAQKRVLERTGQRTGDVADRIAELELQIYEEFRLIQLAKGVAKPLTADQIRGMISEKTKRKASDAQDELLKALGGGIGMVFEKALGGGSQPAAIEPPIEDAEVVEDE